MPRTMTGTFPGSGRATSYCFWSLRHSDKSFQFIRLVKASCRGRGSIPSIYMRGVGGGRGEDGYVKRRFIRIQNRARNPQASTPSSPRCPYQLRNPSAK